MMEKIACCALNFINVHQDLLDVLAKQFTDTQIYSSQELYEFV